MYAQPLCSFNKRAGWIYAILTFESKFKGGYILTLKEVVNDSLFMPKFCKMTNKSLICHIVYLNWCEQTQSMIVSLSK